MTQFEQMTNKVQQDVINTVLEQAAECAHTDESAQLITAANQLISDASVE